MPKICPLARSSRVGKRAGQDGLAGPATLDGPAAGTRRPPRRRGGLIGHRARVVCEATARRRCVRRRMRLAVRWDGGMVRSVDELMIKYKGRERALYNTIKKKYRRSGAKRVDQRFDE